MGLRTKTVVLNLPAIKWPDPGIQRLPGGRSSSAGTWKAQAVAGGELEVRLEQRVRPPMSALITQGSSPGTRPAPPAGGQGKAKSVLDHNSLSVQLRAWPRQTWKPRGDTQDEGGATQPVSNPGENQEAPVSPRSQLGSSGRQEESRGEGLMAF